MCRDGPDIQRTPSDLYQGGYSVLIAYLAVEVLSGGEAAPSEHLTGPYIVGRIFHLKGTGRPGNVMNTTIHQMKAAGDRE